MPDFSNIAKKLIVFGISAVGGGLPARVTPNGDGTGTLEVTGPGGAAIPVTGSFSSTTTFPYTATTSGQTATTGSVLGAAGVYNASPPTLTTGQVAPLQQDVNGNLKVAGSFATTTTFPYSGTVSGQTATTGSVLGAAGVYNSAPPTLTSGQVAPLQQDVNGNLKTNVTNFPTTQVVSGTVGVSNFPVTQPVSGTVTITPSGTQTVAGSVSVSNFPATQPVSGTVGVSSLPALPTGANAIGSVSVSNFPATQPVSGTVGVNNFPASQVVSGTVALGAGSAAVGSVSVSNFPATQPVSGTVAVSTLPALPTGANTIGAISNTGFAVNAALPTGTNAIGTVGVTSLPALPTGTNAIGSVSVSNFPATQPVSGTVGVNNFPATQAVSGTVAVSTLPALPTGANAIGSVSVSNFPATQAVSLATNTPTLQAGSTTTVTQATGTNLHVVVDSAPSTAVTGTVSVSNFPATQITATSGTKQRFSLAATAVAGATAETAFTIASVVNGVAGTAAASYTVPTGKTLRLVSARFATRGSAAGTATFRLRNTSLTGAVELVVSQQFGATTGDNAHDVFTFPDAAQEYVAGVVLVLSQISSVTTVLLDVQLIGYLF